MRLQSLGRLVALACLAAGAHAQSQAPGLPQAVGAPHYGATLFEVYQDHSFAALTGLMVSQHFGRIAPHDDEAEVLRGGLLLAWGLHREAGEVFARLIDGQATPAVRNRAWFLLARVRQQRGLNAEAEEALARISAPLAGTMEEDHQLLRAQLRMQRGDFAGAAQVLEALQGSATAGQIARFNLGVAWIRAGEATRGQALLDQVGRTPAADEETRSLRDRANLALGLAAMQAGAPAQAHAVLQRVRLQGAQSGPALLADGWAAAALQQPRQALVPWTELAGRDDADAAVWEARIALPYALAEAGAEGPALRGYEQALADFAQQDAALSASMAAVRSGAMAEALLALNPSERPTAFTGIAHLPQLPQLPHARQLAPVLASTEFQEAFKNLRDLHFLAANLRQWQDTLVTFDDMRSNRLRGFAERLPAVRAQAAGADIEGLRQRRDALAAELARVQDDGDAFADARERDLAARIARGRAALAQAGGEGNEASERLRRAEGALIWQQAQALPARRWSAQKALRDSGPLLAGAQAQAAALAQAQRDEPARLEAFGTRIQALAARLAALAPQVAALSGEQQARLQDIAVAGLQAQQQRLADYSAQARLAIAQLRDRALVAQARNPEARP
jgi:hypothetical protein